MKASLRALPLAMAKGRSAGTTIAATAFRADRVGVRVFSTGGLRGGFLQRETGERGRDVDVDVFCGDVGLDADHGGPLRNPPLPPTDDGRNHDVGGRQYRDDMPRVVYYTATTLNGFLADDADSLDWLFAVPGGEGGDADFTAFLQGIGVLVQGSTTYEWVLEHEDLLANPEKWPSYYGDRPTYVFTSRTLPSVPGADIRFVSGDVTAAWPAIRDAAGDRDVWVVGGGDLAGQFADAGLLDALRISVAPATLVSGKPLLPRRIGSDRLVLQKVQQMGQFAELTYAVSH